MDEFTCGGCGKIQPVTNGRSIGQNLYSHCDFCGCATKISSSNEVFICSTCGIVVLRAPGFVGNECDTCEDHKLAIKGEAWDLAKKYNMTLGQLVRLVKNTPIGE